MKNNCGHDVLAPLKFIGAVEASYNGEEQVTVCIPVIKMSELINELVKNDSFIEKIISSELINELVKNDSFIEKIISNEVFIETIVQQDIFKTVVEQIITEVIDSGSSTTQAITNIVNTIVDDKIAAALGNYLPLSGGTMSGNINMGGKDITNVNDIQST